MRQVGRFFLITMAADLKIQAHNKAHLKAMGHLYIRLCLCISIIFRPILEHTAWAWCRDAVSEAKASTYVPKDTKRGDCCIVASHDCLETILPLSLCVRHPCSVLCDFKVFQLPFEVALLRFHRGPQKPTFDLEFIVRASANNRFRRPIGVQRKLTVLKPIGRRYMQRSDTIRFDIVLPELVSLYTLDVFCRQIPTGRTVL